MVSGTAQNRANMKFLENPRLLRRGANAILGVWRQGFKELAP